MKRMLTLCLAAILMLTSAAALAETAAYRPTLQAEKLAIAAMYEQYGFTLETLGVFTIISAEKEGSYYVSFQTDFLPYSRVGQYDAIVTGSEVSLKWTHDDSDHSLLKSGDPASPCWGVKQIEAYLAVDIGERHKWVKPYFDEGENNHEVSESIWDDLGLTRIPEDEEKPIPDALRAAADAAVKDVYALTEERFAQLERPACIMGVAADGRTYYELTYSEYDLCFHVLVDAETNELIDISLFSGGNG